MIYAALKRLTKHSAIYALGPAVNKVLSFVLLPLVTAYIGSTQNYGVVEMAGVTIAIAGQVLGINLLHGMTRFHGEYEKDEDRATLVTTTLWMLTISTGIALALAATFRVSGARLLFDSPAPEYAAAFVASAGILFFQTVGQVGLRYLQILERSVLYGVLTTVKMLSENGFKVWFLVGLGLMTMGPLYSVLGGEAIVAVTTVALIISKLGLRFSWPMAKRLLVYSSPLIVSGLCMFVLHQSDRFFVQRMVSADELGVYSLGYKLGAIANTVILEAFGLIWFPYVFGLRDDEQVKLVCRTVLSYFTLLMCVASLGLALFAPEIVHKMADPKFADASRTMPVIAAGYLFWSVFQVVSTGFYVRQKTVVVSAIVAGAALLNLVLNTTLVPRLGSMGAAWATVGTFAALAIACWIGAERVMRVGYEIGRVVAPIALGSALYVASRWLPAEWSMSMTLLAKLALVMALPLLLALGGYLRADEKAKIRELATAFAGRRETR